MWGDGLDRVMEPASALSAVAEDLVDLHPADHMFHPGTSPVSGPRAAGRTTATGTGPRR
jgi:hypothetical protein